MEMKRKLSDGNCILENQKKKVDNLTRIDFTDCVSVPRLKSIAIVQVVTILCKQHDIRDAIMQESYKIVDEETDLFRFIISSPIVENILNKVSLLPLPNLTKEEVTFVITPIVIQIFKWLHGINTDNCNLDKIRYSSLNFLCWSSNGILDRVQTLKQFIEANSNSDLFKSKKISQHIYGLSCTFCVEDIIPSLWGKLVKESKGYYLKSRLNKYDYKHLIAYWSFVNNNELSKLSQKIGSHFDMYDWEDSIFQNMFSLALHQSNILAVKYFWDKLTDEERICNVEQWVDEAVKKLNDELDQYCSYLDTNDIADILYFLLSKVSAETQKEVIQENSHVILQSLYLFWPYQRFLLPTIQTVWDSLDYRAYIKLLYTVARRASKDKKSLTILKELCCASPINLKQCFIHDFLTSGLFNEAQFVLKTLVAMEDIRTCKEIIIYANVEERNQIAEEIISALLYNHKLIDEDKLKFIDKFLQESLLSESYMINLKEKIGLKCGIDLCSKWFICNNWEMVEKFLNWAFASQEQINHFKYDIMYENNKMNIIYLLFKKGYYEFVNQFTNWCFSSEQEINQFKKKFALSNPGIIKVCKNDWCLFEKFIAWSALSDEETNEFKLTVKQYDKLEEIIFKALEHRKFQFVDKLINWFCHSNEEIQLYKEECVLSDMFLWTVNLLGKNGKSIKKLFSLFAPISEEVKIKLKENISEGRFCESFVERLFRLLDGQISEDEYFDEASEISFDEVSEASAISFDELSGSGSSYEFNFYESSEASELSSDEEQF